MTNVQILITILMMVAGTVVTRFLPFWIFPDDKEISPYITYLGRVLPYAVIGLLVVYCLKDAAAASWPYALPEALSIIGIVCLHVWRRNTLLSIGAGTVLYMFLIQVVF